MVDAQVKQVRQHSTINPSSSTNSHTSSTVDLQLKKSSISQKNAQLAIDYKLAGKDKVEGAAAVVPLSGGDAEKISGRSKQKFCDS